MVENILVIWLHNNIDDNSADHQCMITQLQHVVNIINTFTDADQCRDFLTKISNEKIVMIISDILCQNIVPLFHDIVQVDTILIFGENNIEYQGWIKDWCKIKGIFPEISSICEALKKAVRRHEQISISIVPTSDDISNENLDRLDVSFMYTQILKEIILTIQFKPEHIKEFSDYCRNKSEEQYFNLTKIEEFEKTYLDQTPIWWYTVENFVYSTLNRALRLMNVDIIIKMGFFIQHLHQNIERLHLKQSDEHLHANSFTVYRGQGISKADMEKMMKTKGGLISFNNFLSTSKDYCLSCAYAESNEYNPELVGVLFIITVDPSKSRTPFASVNDVSQFKTEEEILFSMHTIFRIHDIESLNENDRLFQVELTPTSDDDKDLRALTDYIRKETRPDVEGWYRLGALLFRIGEFEKARQIYEILLDEATNDSAKAAIYHQIGCAKDDQSEYKEAITYYERSLEIEQNQIPVNDRNVANTYHNIGNAYLYMDEYSKALSYYKKALKIRQRILPPDHFDLASTYCNTGNAYLKMGKSSKAFSYYKKALEIAQNSLPSNHPDLASSCNSMGTMYREMRDYPQALSYFEKALKIQQQSLPSNHPSLAISYHNIGAVHMNRKDFSKAISSMERAVDIAQHSLSPDHSLRQKYIANLDYVKGIENMLSSFGTGFNFLITKVCPK